MGRFRLGGCVFAIHDLSDQALFSSFLPEKISFEVSSSEQGIVICSSTANPKLLTVMGRTIKAANYCIEEERGARDEAAPLFPARYRFSNMLHHGGLSALR